MSASDAENGSIYIPITSRCDAGPSSPKTDSTDSQAPETRQSTRSVYTITSTAAREQRRYRLADNARPVSAIFDGANPLPAVTYAPLPTPPSSIKSTSATTSTFEPDPKVYPEANVIHYYTHCEHTSPPATRPLNVQPILIHSTPTGKVPRSTLLGRCYECDSEYRRQQETSVLQKHHHSSNALHLRLLAAREALQRADTSSQVDEDGIDRIVTEVDDEVARREADVKIVWKGFSARWGPGTIGVREGPRGGRMNVKWERPEKKR